MYVQEQLTLLRIILSRHNTIWTAIADMLEAFLYDTVCPKYVAELCEQIMPFVVQDVQMVCYIDNNACYSLIGNRIDCNEQHQNHTSGATMEYNYG